MVSVEVAELNKTVVLDVPIDSFTVEVTRESDSDMLVVIVTTGVCTFEVIFSVGPAVLLLWGNVGRVDDVI